MASLTFEAGWFVPFADKRAGGRCPSQAWLRDQTGCTIPLTRAILSALEMCFVIKRYTSLRLAWYSFAVYSSLGRASRGSSVSSLCCVCDSTRRRERKAAGRRCRVPGPVSRTSARRLSSSATARAARATTSPTSTASGCRRSTRNSSSSRRSRRRSRPATCARASAAARSASRRFGRRWRTATPTGGLRPASCYNRPAVPAHFRHLSATSPSRCSLLLLGFRRDAANARMSFSVVVCILTGLQLFYNTASANASIIISV